MKQTRSIYVVLVHTNSVVAKVISMATNDQYTHAAIALDEDLVSMYSFGRKWSFFPFWGCFKRENFQEGFYATNETLPGMVLRVNVTEEQYQRAQRLIREFQVNQDMLRYDTLGLMISAVGLYHESDIHYTCSKFVAKTLAEAGVCSFEKPLELVRPVDFLTLPSQVVYQGDLKQYAS